jgi:hypothetical protein
VASHNGRTEWDNNYWYGMRPSSVSANAGKSSTVGSGASIDIQNPYIKLIYCKKN